MDRFSLSDELRSYLDLGTKLPVLDGLRGWAITGVVLFHCTVNGFAFFPFLSTLFVDLGWSGVDLFFVLSGFLITNLLLQNKNKKNYFRNFYGRRILRIFPLYYALLLFYLLRHGKLEGFFYNIFYASNFLLIHFRVPYDNPAWLTWSLSIEEQFYLIWPFLIFFLGRRTMIGLCFIFMLAAPIFRLSYFVDGQISQVAYVSPVARMDTLAIGSLIALLLNENKQNLEPLRKIAFLLLLIIPLLLWAQKNALHYIYGPHVTTFGFSLFALIYASLLVVAITDRSKLADLILKNKFILLVGKHSYCMYLIHPQVIQLFIGQTLFHPFLVHPLALLSTLGVSIVIWHVFEKHFIKMKVFFSDATAPQTKAAPGIV